MILDEKSNPNIKICDCNGNMIGYVQKYDTVTKEISMYIPACRGDIKTVCTLGVGAIIPKLITFVLEGSYALDENGEIL